jgi:hypothetical protein
MNSRKFVWVSSRGLMSLPLYVVVVLLLGLTSVQIPTPGCVLFELLLLDDPDKLCEELLVLRLTLLLSDVVVLLEWLLKELDDWLETEDGLLLDFELLLELSGTIWSAPMSQVTPPASRS